MGVRESFRQNPAVPIGILALCVALVIGIWFVRAKEEGGQVASGGRKAWYTVDDGRTWFAAPANKVVPFDHEGKPAYRCYVWTCDDGKTKFASHVERLTAAGRQQLGGKDTYEPWELLPGSQEVKSPLSGDKGWVSVSSPGATAIRTPHCPDGKSGTPKPLAAE